MFEPRLTTHGFQYVRVEGHPGPSSTADDLTGVVVHTDLRRTGWFECSDAKVNALHEAAVWSFRGNACDIPTDCPTRERAGWTGDWQLYVPTATFLYDVAGFSDQVAAGPRRRPVGQRRRRQHGADAAAPRRSGFLEQVNGSAGWGDAAVLVPWEIYQEYGDAAAARGAVALDGAPGWTSSSAPPREQRHPSRVEARPEPAPHERYLWDAGFHWGEWLVPGEDLSDFAAFIAADKSDVATAYFARSTEVAAQIARLLGRDDEAARYRTLQRRPSSTPGGGVPRHRGARSGPRTQANLVRALTFGLVPDERCGVRRRPARRAGPRQRHPPGDRLPGHPRPAARRWPTPVTSTSRTTCSSRTPRPPG